MSFGSKERGYYAPVLGGTFLLFCACVIGVIGWATIEFLLWLLSFVTISFGG